MSLQDEIADEYLPDINVNGMDCPDTESAKEIINKVLDAVDNAIESVDYEDSVAGNGAINNALNAINKLRPES